jgi:hypothetical protein
VGVEWEEARLMEQADTWRYITCFVTQNKGQQSDNTLHTSRGIRLKDNHIKGFVLVNQMKRRIEKRNEANK